MEDYEVKLEQIIENKQYMDCETLKNISNYICENNASIKLLYLIKEYLEIYPQQISLIPKSNIHFIN